MAMIVVAGTIDIVDHSTVDAVLAGSLPFQQGTRQDEAGCLAYCFAADPVVPGRIQVHELWADEPSLDAHFEHPNYLNMRNHLVASGLAGADTHKYRIDAVSRVYDASGKPTASFDGSEEA